MVVMTSDDEAKKNDETAKAKKDRTDAVKEAKRSVRKLFDPHS